MRPSPVVDMRAMRRAAGAGFFAAAFLMAGSCYAQTAATAPPYTAPPGPTTVPVPAPPIDRASFLQGMQAALQVPVGDGPVPIIADPAARDRTLGSATDPESPRYKANQLAEQARQQRNAVAGMNAIAKEEGPIDAVPPPPEIDSLQFVNESHGDDPASISDDPVNKEIALDMRKEAQKEAALSYGARGGLAKRNYQIMERMKGFDVVLDRVFDFRALLIRAPSGLLIEPPIVKESLDAMVITEGGAEAAVADRVLDINKKANIVSAPRNWRQYLIQTWSEVPPPPRVLWPKNKSEQASWGSWVAEGWDAGFEQADQIFESNVNLLVAEYNGMVRYRMLLAQGMISAPYAMHEDRGVTGDKNQMRVGDRAVRITGPSQFLTGAELWKPADR